MDNGTLDSLIEELNRILLQAEAEVYTRQKALDEAKKEAQRVRSMLRAAGALEEEPKESKATPRRKNITDETRKAVMEAILQAEIEGQEMVPGVPGSFTVTSLVTSVHASSVNTAMHVLREEGVIRAVGLVPNSPRKAPMAYARVSYEH
jgi:hypothetical protein